MYDSQNIATRIKLMAKQRSISVNQLLQNCDLGKNTVAKMAGGTDILTQNFARIADCLDCSVDYLLGRTDVPEINRGTGYGYGYPPQYAQMAADTGDRLEGVLAPDKLTEMRALEEYHRRKQNGE